VTLSWIPNALTLARLALVGPVLWSLSEGWILLAAGLFAVAAVTDALDGYLARRLSACTALGAALDPLADKAMLSGAYVVLAWQGVLPVWLGVLVVGRDVAILAAASAVRLRWGAFAPRPSSLSKINTVAQVALAVLAMVQEELAPGWDSGSADTLILALIVMVVLTTVGSGLGYAWTAWHGLWERRDRGRA